MALSLLFWLALLLPGYVLVRVVSPSDLRSGLLGTVCLSYLAAFTLLSPVSILCYVLQLPVAVLSIAFVVAVAWGCLHVTSHRWWKDIGRLVIASISIELLILTVHLVLGALVGAHFADDAKIHIARIRFLLDHGFSNLDPFLSVKYFFPYYHTNILHGLYASCAQLTGMEAVGVWYGSLPWAKLVIVSASYWLGWCLFERQWVAWVIALFVVAWKAPITFVVYPNKIAPLWLVVAMLGFAVQACQSPDKWIHPLKLTAASLVLGQVHSLYAIFAAMALAPLFACLLVYRILKGHTSSQTTMPLAACMLALCAAAPFALVSKHGRGADPQTTARAQSNIEKEAPSPEISRSSVKHSKDRRFRYTANGWAMFKPERAVGGLSLGRFGLLWLGAGVVGGLLSTRRWQVAALAAMSVTIAAILFIPPLCTATISMLGHPWILTRIGFILPYATIALVLGVVAFKLEPKLPFWWVRGTFSAAVMALGVLASSDTGRFSRSGYYQTAISPGERRAELAGMGNLSRITKKLIPPGATILADTYTAAQIMMVHDCYVVLAQGGHPGAPDTKQRQQDLKTMLLPKTRWERRRQLLKKYDVSMYVMSGHTYPYRSWTEGRIKEQVMEGDYLYLTLVLD